MNKIPSHLAAAIQSNTEVRKPIHRVFLGKNELPVDTERNLVSETDKTSNNLDNGA